MGWSGYLPGREKKQFPFNVLIKAGVSWPLGGSLAVIDRRYLTPTGRLPSRPFR